MEFLIKTPTEFKEGGRDISNVWMCGSFAIG